MISIPKEETETIRLLGITGYYVHCVERWKRAQVFIVLYEIETPNSYLVRRLHCYWNDRIRNMNWLLKYFLKERRRIQVQYYLGQGWINFNVLLTKEQRTNTSHHVYARQYISLVCFVLNTLINECIYLHDLLPPKITKKDYSLFKTPKFIDTFILNIIIMNPNAKMWNSYVG